VPRLIAKAFGHKNEDQPVNRLVLTSTAYRFGQQGALPVPPLPLAPPPMLSCATIPVCSSIAGAIHSFVILFDLPPGQDRSLRQPAGDGQLAKRMDLAASTA
jgi:hypothetical protein